MELLDRYLQAVRFWLPRAQQDDMIAELGDDLRSQIEDRESALGRPLNEAELVALLQQTGHPMRVAARYQPQQSLIGPGLFPIYKFVLKVVSVAYLGPWFLVWLGITIFNPSHRADTPLLAALSGWAAMWSNIFFIFGLITLIFAVLERVQAHVPELHTWDPRKLPAVKKEKANVSRVESIFELVFSVLFIVGWLAAPGIASSIFAQTNVLAAVPGLAIYFWLFLIPAVLSMLQQLINLIRPDWTWLRPPARLVSTTITLGLTLCFLRLSPHYVVVSNLAADTQNHARYEHLAFVVNQLSQYCLMSLALGLAIAMCVQAYQTVKVIRKHTGSPQAGAGAQVSQLL